MRVVPEDFRISTRVVTSNVRQPSDAAPSANRLFVFENATPAVTAPADRTKSRRFIELFRLNIRLSDIVRFGGWGVRRLLRREGFDAQIAEFHPHGLAGVHLERDD